MNITLISPYSNAYAFGLRTLSSCLKLKGHGVKLIFLPKDFRSEYDAALLDELVSVTKGSGLAGISLMTNFFANSIQITKKIKEELNIPVIWGGIHPTILPKECLEYADYVCLGEGEEVFPRFVDRLENDSGFDTVPGVWLKRNGKVVENALQPIIHDLNAVPFQDYGYDSQYIYDGKHIVPMSEALLQRHTSQWYMTMPSRGCPFGCTYCCNNIINKMYPEHASLRKRNIDNIINELKIVKTKLPFMEYIYFADDTFFSYTLEEIKEFSLKYKKEIGLPLCVAGATPSTLTREKLSLLVDAGLRDTRMGIQSASESTKRLYRRGFPNEQVLKAAKIINEFKDKIIMPQYDIILDNPWETEEDLFDTLKFLTKIPAPCYFSLFSLTLYPGSDLYEKAKKENRILSGSVENHLKGFHEYKKSFPNRLFMLLSQARGRLSEKTLALLMNRTLRLTGLSILLYHLLFFYYSLIKNDYLIIAALKDIRSGNWSRIKRNIRGFFKV